MYLLEATGALSTLQSLQRNLGSDSLSLVSLPLCDSASDVRLGQVEDVLAVRLALVGCGEVSHLECECIRWLHSFSF